MYTINSFEVDFDAKNKVRGSKSFMILAVIGPTGVGKTKLSIELAKKYDAIIVNCDAMQVYKDLNIGTAKIKEEEKEGIPHFLFDFVPVTTNYTVYDYQQDARMLLKKYANRNIIFVGGTGLYLRASLFDYRFSFEDDVTFDGECYSNEELYEMCLLKDSNCDIHPHNRKRLIRFLQKKEVEKVEPKLLYPTIFIGLTTERSRLYQMIDDRVDQMMEEGLLEEVRPFFEKKIYSKALTTGIGYKELYKYLDGELSFEEAVTLIKKNSRHYAKRQYTFFRHQFDVKWFSVNYENFDRTVEEVEQYIESF